MEHKTSNKRIKDLLPGEEVVICGISGRYPQTADVNQFRDNLYNKFDMITEDTRKWNHFYPDIPERSGRLINVTEFDAGAFGLTLRQTKSTDPMISLVLQTTYEAILDAGYHPSYFKGTNTGVFVGACMSETEQVNFFKRLIPQSSALLGNTRSMIANRISYWLKLKGPSFVADTACSSSMFAFDQAYRALLEDRCDHAIVASSNLCLHPYISLQFALLGVLSVDGACKTFDENANGYARSEGVVVVILTKAKNSRRIYAEVVHSKTNCDGYKEQGITYPSGKVQINLLEDFYDECGRSPLCHSFMEAHGTGTPVGDPEELQAIDAACAIGRKKPLYIGSVKSNIGHNEPVSGLCSVTKVIVGFENDAIPPNMNFKEIRKCVEGLEKKRMIVVAEKMPWPDNEGLAGVNCFGFGGANSHVLLCWHKKLKINQGIPKDNLPRLICFSGRTKKTLSMMTDDLKSRPLDAELVALYHNIFMKNFPLHSHRGYIILSKFGMVNESSTYYEEQKDLLIHFGNIDVKLPRLLNDLLEIQSIRNVYERFEKVYKLQNIPFDLQELLTSYDDNNTIHNLIGNVLMQMGMYETLKTIDLNMKNMHGSLIGTLTLSYAKNIVSIEEVAIISYLIALILIEHNKCDDYKSNALTRSDSMKLGKKLHDGIRQLLYNKKGKDLDKEEEDLVNYLVRNLLNDDNAQMVIPKKSVLLECGTSNRQRNNVEVMQIVNYDCENPIESLLINIGRVYLLGHDVCLDKLYPKVSFPVSRGTPMIGPVVKLRDANKLDIVAKIARSIGLKSVCKVVITSRSKEWRYITGHVIDGRNLVPATGYLFVVWNVFSKGIAKAIHKLNVTFHDIKFQRAITVPKSGDIILEVLIFGSTGYFEITEKGSVMVTGRITEQFAPKEFETLTGLDEDNSHELNEKDIYKELRLRGYNYNGMFRSLKKCNLNATKGMIQWQNNWVAFLDNMLQIILLQSDSRNLYVPTAIDLLTINAPCHMEHVESLGEENPLVPVYVWKDAGVIRTDAIELRGMNARSINRRKTRAEPVLEYYNFLPNETNLTLEESVRANIQIMLENTSSLKIKTVELIDENVTEDYVPFSPVIFQVLGDVPLLQPEVLIYTKKTDMEEIDNVTIENKELDEEVAAYFICGSNLLKTPENLTKVFLALRDDGFLISRESLDYRIRDFEDYSVFSVHRTDTETFVLLRKQSKENNNNNNNKCKFMDISNKSKSFEWLETLQNLIKSNEETIVLYAEDDRFSGILGFVNCLRREQSGSRFRCVYVKDRDAPKFDPQLDLYKRQLDKGMGLNVYQNKCWGTYRHLLLDDTNYIESDWSFVNSLVLGDLNSLRWMHIEPPKRFDDRCMVNIHYSALNFRDIMIASGRLSLDVICNDRLKQNSYLGFEFSGITSEGKRVFGLSDTGALATKISAERSFLYEVPNDWTLEDAVSVPLVYITAVTAMINYGKLKRGESVLIHSGTGGVGQAALNMATYYECNIFTTCGTDEKREFLRKNYPHIPESHIGNSRDTSFVQMIKRETNGKGVDVILNSLAEEKLIATLECLGAKGRFLEIGKFDISVDNPLALGLLKNEQCYHGIMLDLLFKWEPYRRRKTCGIIIEGLRRGFIKPITTTIFEKDDVINAFRHMTSGKHIGKVVIRMKDPEKPVTMQKCLPRVYCNPDNTTVILGGLGGFGLELADWLILRGCRNIVLNTRNGIVNGYQALRIRIWKSYNVNVVISKDNSTTRKGCESLLMKSQKLGPIEYVFNVAVVLRDKLFENQTPDDFETSFAGKAYATEYLDELTRELCPDLKNFVVFSSVSCGRGNAGQTNYGMANSIMERICEKRKTDGYPALVVQWGAVGDVGLVAEMFENATDLAIAGTLQQRIISCLSLLDNFMFQKHTIVASMVVAEKRAGSGEMGIIETVANILGIRDIKTVSPHITLPELGMDSMMGVEVKQTLEREYDIFLSAQDMRTMTFYKLQELIQEKEQGQKKLKSNLEQTLLLFRFIEEEEIAKIPLIKVNPDVPDNDNLLNVYIVPGVEGMFKSIKPLACNLKGNVYCVQYGYGLAEECVEDIAVTVVETLLTHNKKKMKPYVLIGHSYGTIVTIEAYVKLQQLGYNNCKLILIDGSPVMMKAMCQKQLVSEDDVNIQMTLLGGLLSQIIPLPDLLKHKEELEKCKSYEERVWYLLDRAPGEIEHSKEYQAKLSISFYKRIKSVLIYEYKHMKIDCNTFLYKPTVATLADANEDFNLSDICNEPITIKYFDGDHVTILENDKLAADINRVLGFNDDVEKLNVNGTITTTEGLTPGEAAINVDQKEFTKLDVKHISTKSEAVKI